MGKSKNKFKATCAKEIKKRGADFLEKANKRIAKAKLDKEYLIKG